MAVLPVTGEAALVDAIAAAGGSKPLCVGIESGQATGWPFTDWTEDLVLRFHGGDVYDEWVAGTVDFADERITAIFKSKTRDQWCEIMEGSDVCFAPVLTMSAAAEHPHNVARGTFVDLGGTTQPAPAPRFSRWGTPRRTLAA